MTSASRANKNEHAPTTPSAKHTVPQLSYDFAARRCARSSILDAVRDWEYEGGLVAIPTT